MAGNLNKFVSWTQNIVKNKNAGVGINLALVSPKSSIRESTESSSTHYKRVGVDSVEPNGPAAKAGLKIGDAIVEVDGKKFDDGKPYLPDDVAVAIRGPEGSQVSVVVERDGERVTFVVTRKPMKVAALPPLSPATTKKTVTMKPEAVVASQSKKQSEGKDATKKKMQGGNKQKEASPQKNKRGESQIKKDDAANNLESLTLEEEEHKERDLASSSMSEAADQFDDTKAEAPNLCRSRLGSRNSNDEFSEEKTVDNNEEISSIINSVGDDSNGWEMLSERSGSALVISFSGSMSGTSFRSPSPSVLKNKFVLTESTGEAYIEHVVLPTDTLQGLCLAYKISATRLRTENSFSGNSLQMAPRKLRVPTDVKANTKGVMIRTQDKTSKEFKLYAFVAEIPTMSVVEAKAYLDLSNWDLDEGLRSAREDEGWKLKGGFESSSADELSHFGSSSPLITAVAKPKALTVKDIYAAPPPFEGDGFELKSIKRDG